MPKRISAGEIVQKGWHPLAVTLASEVEGGAGWVDVDLAPYVGHQAVLAYLRVLLNDGDNSVWVRPDLSADDYDAIVSTGMFQGVSGKRGYLIAETNALGAFEYSGLTALNTFSLYLIGYID